MRTIAIALLLFLLFVLAAPSAPAQTRTVQFDLTDVQVGRTLLTVLPDGGCFAEWCGAAPSVARDDVTLTVCKSREITVAANRTRCLQVISAGVPVVAQELKIIADGGAP